MMQTEEIQTGSDVESFKQGVESQRRNTGGDKTRKKKTIERNPGFY